MPFIEVRRLCDLDQSDFALDITIHEGVNKT
jgi:hypothetical protein